MKELIRKPKAIQAVPLFRGRVRGKKDRSSQELGPFSKRLKDIVGDILFYKALTDADLTKDLDIDGELLIPLKGILEKLYLIIDSDKMKQVVNEVICSEKRRLMAGFEEISPSPIWPNTKGTTQQMKFIVVKNLITYATGISAHEKRNKALKEWRATLDKDMNDQVAIVIRCFNNRQKYLELHRYIRDPIVKRLN